MKTNSFFKREILMWLALLAPFVMVVLCWNDFPDRIPTHWNINNEVDDWSDKVPALFLFPGINIALYLLMLFLPKLDPKRNNYERFGKAWWSIRFALHVFFSGVVFLTMLAALGTDVNIGRVLTSGICLLFLVIGNVLGTVKFNYFVGVRTPWTLSDEEVWNKTHRLTARVWVITSLLLIIPVVLLPMAWMAAVFGAGVVTMVLVPMVYSYRLYSAKRAQQK